MKIEKNMLEEKEHGYSVLAMAMRYSAYLIDMKYAKVNSFEYDISNDDSIFTMSISIILDWLFSRIKDDGSAGYLNEFDYDLSLSNIEDEIEKYEIGDYWSNPIDLRHYYNILKFDETMNKLNKPEYNTKYSLVGNDSQKIPADDYIELFDENDGAIYNNEVKVLIIDDYPSHRAIKIGETYEECEYIGYSNELSDLYRKIIKYLGKN